MNLGSRKSAAVPPSKVRRRDAGEPDTLFSELERELMLLSRLLVAARTKLHYDLERAHYVILNILDTKGPQPIGMIAKDLLLDNSTASRQVAAMERIGLAERRSDPDDQRRSIVSCTTKGQRMMAEMQQLRMQHTEFILSDWPEEDLEHLSRLLKTFNRTMIEKLSRCEPK